LGTNTVIKILSIASKLNNILSVILNS
jgi:hypothetical protein